MGKASYLKEAINSREMYGCLDKAANETMNLTYQMISKLI